MNNGGDDQHMPPHLYSSNRLLLSSLYFPSGFFTLYPRLAAESAQQLPVSNFKVTQGRDANLQNTCNDAFGSLTLLPCLFTRSNF